MRRTSEHDPVKRWFRNSRSEVSRKSRLAILDHFCRSEGISREKLLELAGKVPPGKPQSKIEEIVGDYLDKREASGLMGSTVAKEFGAISGFLRANNVLIQAPKRLSLKPRLEIHRLLEKEEVRAMMAQFESEPRKKAVILTLAQTGQRIRVLTALAWPETKRELAVIKEFKGSGWGYVTINPGMRNWLGETFNKLDTAYTFCIHPETMRFLKQIREGQDDIVFHVHPRRLQEVVEYAAAKAGIQRPIASRLESREWHEVHAHVFRGYWKYWMREGGVYDPDLLRYLMGQKVMLAYDRFPLEKLLHEYKKAEASLSLLSPF